jgi:uracil-DNA glycosylase family 4
VAEAFTGIPEETPPGPTHPSCQQCGRYTSARYPFRQPAFDRPEDRTCDVLIVGQKPGFLDDDLTGRTFSDSYSLALRAAEAEVGLNQFVIARQYAVRCATANPQKPNPEHVKLCATFLRQDIAALKPRLVIPLGNEALKGVVGKEGITQNHGKQIVVRGTTVLPMYHPAYVERDPRFKKDLVQDLTQAREFLIGAKGGRPIWERLKERYHLVLTREDLAHWYAFLMAHRGPLAFDSEYYPLDFMAEDYKVLMVQFSWGPGTGVAFPVDHPQSPFRHDPVMRAALVRILETHELIAQNATVDVRAGVELGADFWKMNVVWETLLASIRINGVESSHALKQLAYTNADTGGYEDELEEFKRRSLEVQAILDKQHAGPKERPSDDKIFAAIAFREQWDGRLYDGVGYDSIPLTILASPYACLHYHSKVQMADGTWESIGKLVRTRSTALVRALDEQTGQFVERRIVGWHKTRRKRAARDWRVLNLKNAQSGKWREFGAVFTADHRILTTRGWVEVQHLVPGDGVAVGEPELTRTERQVILGSLLGDGSICRRATSSFIMGHCEAQRDYLRFKAALLQNLGPKERAPETPGKGAFGKGTLFYKVETRFSRAIADLADGTAKITESWLDALGALGLACWYLDDGTLADPDCSPSMRFNTHAYSREELELVVAWMRSRHRIEPRIDPVSGRPGQWMLRLRADDSRAFAELICAHVPPSMQYKLPPAWRGRFVPREPEAPSAPHFCTLNEVRRWDRKTRPLDVTYCLDVEGARNFITMNAIAHNCGDTDTTFQLYLRQREQMRERGELWYFENIFRHAWRANYVMQAIGINIDWHEWRLRSDYWTAEKHRLYDSILTDPKVAEFAAAREATGKSDFSLNSDPQMRELLFDVLGLEPSGRLTEKTRDHSLDDAAMKEIEANPRNANHPILRALMQYGKVGKLLGTYVTGFAEKTSSQDGRVHAGFHNFVNGGRRGSKKPNVQNVPSGKPAIVFRDGTVGFVDDAGTFRPSHTIEVI